MAEQHDRQLSTRINPGFIKFARQTYGRILRGLYKMKIVRTEAAAELSPPYIILSNHVNTFDPILISVMYNYPIRWVAGDTLFRNPVLAFLLRNLVGSISKSKSRSDYYTIREMTRIVREERGVIGIFPEGQRTWDGVTLPLYYSTAKLVKMLKVPVLICILEGGYQTLPRWSNKRRPGRLILSFRDPIMPEAMEGKSVDEIYHLLTRSLEFDADAYQHTHRIRFRGRKRAEYLEHVLYDCPKCGTLVSMVSESDTVSCSRCGLLVYMDEYGFLSSRDAAFSFSTVAQWNRWQQEDIRIRIRNGEWRDGTPIFYGDVALFGVGYRDRKMQHEGNAEVFMDQYGLTVKTQERTVRFMYDQMESVNVAFQRVFEFYARNRLYRLKFPPPRSSAYKYLSLYECLMEERSSHAKPVIAVESLEEKPNSSNIPDADESLPPLDRRDLKTEDPDSPPDTDMTVNIEPQEAAHMDGAPADSRETSCPKPQRSSE